MRGHGYGGGGRSFRSKFYRKTGVWIRPPQYERGRFYWTPTSAHRRGLYRLFGWIPDFFDAIGKRLSRNTLLRSRSIAPRKEKSNPKVVKRSDTAKPSIGIRRKTF